MASSSRVMLARFTGFSGRTSSRAVKISALESAPADSNSRASRFLQGLIVGDSIAEKVNVSC